MKKTIPKLLTLVCLLVAVMGLSIVTAHAATVTGTVSSGNEYRYHEDKSPVPQWGAFTSTKLKYFTRNDTGVTVPAYCMEPSARSASGDLSYSSTSCSSLSWNQRYAVTLALSYGYGGNYDFYGIHPDRAQLATQAVIWEFVCGYRGTTYPYTLYDTTCANLFHYAGDGVQEAYDILIDRIMGHGVIPSFAVKYRNQLSDANAITLTWDGSQYVGTATDTNAESGKALAGVTYRLYDSAGKKVADMTTGADGKAVFKDLPQGKYSYQEISAPSGYVVDNTKYQITITTTVLNITQKRTNAPARASIEIVKVDADHKTPLQGVGFRLYDTSGKQVAEGYTDANGKLTFSGLRLGNYTYKEFKAPDGYVLDDTAYSAVLNKNGQVLKVTRENMPVKGSIEVLKVDAETKQPMAGVVYRLFDADGSKIADGTTDATGEVTFSGLRLGKYVYQEISTVDGYVLDETKYDFSLTTANLNIKVTRENAPAKGSITVRKVDVTGNPLAGAELMLETSADGKTWTEVGRVTTDKTGIAKWSDLKIGVKYRVTETKAPAGYTLLTEPLFTGTLDSSNRDITITACNNAGFSLPFTGGTGFTTYFLFAALMLCMGVYFCKKSDFTEETSK